MEKFYISSLGAALWVGISITLLGSYIQEVMNISKNYWLSSFIFFATTLIYFLARSKNGLNVWSFALSKLIIVSLIGSGLITALSKLKPFFQALSLIILLGSICLAYFFPIFRGIKLREVPSLKIFLIAFIWSCTLVILPLQIAQSPWNFSCFILWTSCFFYVLGLTIPFDIRDIHKDSSSLQTLGQRLGIQAARIFSLVALLLSWALMRHTQASKIELRAYTVSLLIAGTLVIFSSPKRNKIYYSFFMEGCSLLPLLLTRFFERV